MKKGLLLTLLFGGLILLFTTCRKTNETKGVVSKAVSEPVVARINDKEITLTEFLDRLKEYPSLAHGGEIDSETKKGFLDNLIVRELLFQEALRIGIDKEKDTVDFIEEMKKRVIVDKFFKKAIDEKAGVSEEEIKKFYDEHPEETKSPDEIRASHILLKTREEAETIKKKLKRGARFEDLAKKFSTDPGSREAGGDLGVFSRGMMVSEFDTTAFNLKTGEVSDVVQTRFGFHIIKVIEKREGKQKSLEEAKKEIEKMLLAQKRKERFDNLVAELKSKAKIDINTDILLGTHEQGKSDEK